jgi:hypothetical protein
MKDSGRLLWLSVGLVLGVSGAALFLGRGNPAWAANDRVDDYVMCTGAVSVVRGITIEGVWLLDYRSGKLLATMVNRTDGKLVGWAEVDLVKRFDLAPRQNVHFLMTAGTVAPGQAALYVAETNSGKLGVFTMGPRTDGSMGVVVREHEMGSFRAPVVN